MIDNVRIEMAYWKKKEKNKIYIGIETYILGGMVEINEDCKMGKNQTSRGHNQLSVSTQEQYSFFQQVQSSEQRCDFSMHFSFQNFFSYF